MPISAIARPGGVWAPGRYVRAFRSFLGGRSFLAYFFFGRAGVVPLRRAWAALVHPHLLFLGIFSGFFLVLVLVLALCFFCSVLHTLIPAGGARLFPSLLSLPPSL